MVCSYSPQGKKKGCQIYREGSYKCEKSDYLDYCGKYKQLKAEEESMEAM